MRQTNVANTPLALAVKTVLIGSSAAIGLSVGAAKAEFDITPYGYVKADAILDLDHTLGDTLNASAVPVGNAVTDDGSFRSHARQSRFGLNISDSERGLGARIEGDFFGGGGNEVVSNSSSFRLRHAFITAGNWTFGQTWSVFMDRDFIAYPTTVDFAGPAGVTFARQSQIRYSIGGFDIALENPETTIGGLAAGESKVDKAPDITARYTHSGDSLSWYVAGLAQQYEVTGGGPNNGQNASNVGVQGGINVSVGDSLQLFGTAIVNGGRYTYYGFVQPQAVIANGSLETVESTAYSLGANINWGGAYNARSVIVFGTTTIDDEYQTQLSALQSATNTTATTEEMSTLHINYWWTPVEDWDLGIELSSASRELFNGTDGDAARLQFAAQVSF